MKIGISMDAYRRVTDPVTAVKKLAGIGFNALDFNFSDYCFEDSVLAGSGWKEVITQIKKAGDDSGIKFSQLHSPFFMTIDDNTKDGFNGMMMERSFESCSILGSDWAVIHSVIYNEGITKENYESTKSYNIERVQRLCSRAKEYGIGIALENIYRFDDELKKEGINQTTDTINIIEGSSCDNLCVCLDTGHAFYEGIVPADAVKGYGSRLKVLHVHDNNGNGDQHVAPFVGRINWDEFMKALKETNYEGVFSLEIHNYVQRMPPDLIDDAVTMAYKIARYLVDKE